MRTASGTPILATTQYSAESMEFQLERPEMGQAIRRRLAGCFVCWRWGGKGAEILGLKDEVERKDFVALINNPLPGANGERFTASGVSQSNRHV
jgi:hypothetical protein